MPQKNFVTGGWEPEYQDNVASGMRRLGDDAPSAEKTRVSIFNHQKTQSLMLDAVDIVTFDIMRERFWRWSESMSFETHCRGARQKNGKSSGEAPQREAPLAADWYRRYMRSKHIDALRAKANRYYNGCVLCGTVRGGWHLHHRHYNSLGNEDVSHVSVLCQSHHAATQCLLSVRVPARIPDAVQRVFDRESGRQK